MRGDNLSLVLHEAALRAWFKRFGFVPCKDCIDASHKNETVCSILILAIFGAFIATAIGCLQDNRKDTVGRHRQMLYHKIFVGLLPLDYSQIIGTIRSFLEN